jgi:hypothetical protein
METKSKTENIRVLCNGMKEFKERYEPRVHLIKDENSDLLMNFHSIADKWRNYFNKLLNIHAADEFRVLIYILLNIHTAFWVPYKAGYFLTS